MHGRPAAPTQAERKTKKNKSIRDALPREGGEKHHGCFFAAKIPPPADAEDGTFCFYGEGQRDELLHLALGLHALLVVEDLLADAQVLGSDLQQLVLSQEFEAALEAQLADGDEAQSVVRAGSTGIGQVLGLADVDIDILAGSGVADDHALVDLLAGAHQQSTALLRVEQAVGDGLAGLKADQRTGGAVGDHASPDVIAVEDLVDDALAVGIGQELVAVAEQAAAGHTELQTHTVGAQRLHLLQDGLALAQTGHDSTLILGGDVDDDVLHRLVGLAVDDLGQNVRGRDLQLIAFAAHGLDEDGQMHLTTAHDTEGIGGGGILHLQSDVLQQLFLQTVTDLAAGDILALTAGQRAVVDGEGHLDGGVVDLQEGQRLDMGGAAQGVADGDIGQTGESHDVACGDVVAGLTAIGLEVIQLGQTAAHLEVGVVPVAHDHFLAHLGDAVLDAADADAANELVVVHRGHQHLEGSLGVALGRLDGAQQGVEQGDQVGAGYIGVKACSAVTAAAEQHGAVQLLVGSAQVHQQVEDLVDDFLDAGIGTVDLVDGDHKAQILLQSLLQHETGLGHAALSSVHQQQNAVDHLQHALDLAAEVGVARGIDDIDLDALVAAGAVLGQNGDAALTLDVTAVHDTLSHSLIVAESAALAQQGVHQRGLAVVNVSDDSDIAQIVTNHKNTTSLF